MARTLYLTNNTPAIGRGDNTAKADGAASGWSPLSAETTQPGGLATTLTATTVAGPTSGVEFGTPTEWISEPCAEAVTIAADITFNLWAFESAMTANAGLQVIIERLDSQGQIASTIINSERGTELGTSAAANNWTATPTSTNMLKGDRFRIRVLINDAGGTMAAANTATLRYNFDAATTADSFVTFGETFNLGATDPSAQTLYFTNTNSDLDTGNSSEKEAWTARGAASTDAVRSTAAGYTTPLQFKNSGQTQDLTWWTKKLQAFTLSGQVKFNVRARESNASANAVLRAEVVVTDENGANPTVWGAASESFELTTGETQRVVRVHGNDLSVAEASRLRFRVYLDDNPLFAMGSGFTATATFNGATSGAAGDTFVVLPTAVSEFVSGTPKAGSEAFAFSEGTTVISITGTLTDAVVVAESASGSVDFARVDSAAFTDSGVKTEQADRAGSESHTQSEGAFQLTQGYAGSESFALTETSAPSATISPTEAFTFSEAAGSIASTLAASDSWALSAETGAQSVTEFKVGSESFALTDLATALAVTLAANDAWVLSEAKNLTALLDKVDAWALSETAALANALAASEAFSLAEASGLDQGAVQKEASDSAAFSDASSTQANVSGLESFTLGELAALSAALAANDIVTLSELADLGVESQKAASDSWIFSDTSSTQANIATAEAFALSELLTLSADLARVDAVSLGAETAALQITNFLAAADSAAVAELAAVAVTLSASDAASLSDIAGLQELKSAFDAALLSVEQATASTGTPAPPIVEPTLAVIELWAASVAITAHATSLDITAHATSAAVDATIGTVTVDPYSATVVITPHTTTVVIS